MEDFLRASQLLSIVTGSVLSTRKIFSPSYLTALFPNIVYFIIYAEFPKEFNKTNRFCIAQTERDI